ncbi:TPA: phage tail protein [Escherichia coli]
MTSEVSLQPDNRTGLQHALEQLLENCIAEIVRQSPCNSLLYPARAPQQFLPALAIERGVHDWSVDDSENAVRQSVGEGLLIQSRACTRGGLETALAALGVVAKISIAGPYAIAVSAALPDNPIGAETYRRLLERVSAYKAERDSVSLALVRDMPVTAWHGVCVMTGQTVRVHCRGSA